MTNTMKRTGWYGLATPLAVGAILVAWGTAAGAAGSNDPLRCAAQELIYASRASNCMARCERIADRRAERDATRADELRPTCEGTCADQYAGAMNRLHARPVCAGTEPEMPNPMECQAKQQRNDAAFLLCQSRCNSRARNNERVDVNACRDACEASYADARDGILAEPVCNYGPVSAALGVADAQ